MNAPAPPPAPILVCGLGHVGIRVAELLVALGERVVAITRETGPAWLRSTAAERIEIRTGDARDEKILEGAGLREARALLALTDQDLANIEIALDARRMRPDIPIVLRLFDQRLAKQLVEGFGIRRATAAADLAAPAFASAAAGAREARVFRIGGEELVLGEIEIGRGSRLLGESAASAGDRSGLLVLEASRSGGLPRSATDPTEPGDRLVLVGPRVGWERLDPFEAGNATTPRRSRPGRFTRGLSALRSAWRETPPTFQAALLVLNLLIAASFFVFRFGMDLPLTDALYFLVTTVTTTGYGDISPLRSSAWVKFWDMLLMITGPASIAVVTTILTDFLVSERFRSALGKPQLPPDGHTIVVGIGGVGYRTLEELHGGGVPLVAVERDERSDHFAATRARGIPIFVGDGRSRAILGEAGVERASVVLSLTGDDAVNLGVALTAREINPRIRTVVRLFDPAMAEKLEASGIVDRAISTSRVAAPSFVAAALEPGLLAALWTGKRLWSVVRRPAGEWAGRTPGELEAAQPIRILERAGAPDTPLASDETIVAAIGREALTRS